MQDQCEFRPVLGFEGYYEVSLCGRIRRVAPGNHTRPGREIHPTPVVGRENRFIVRLTKPGRSRGATTLKLVREAFPDEAPPVPSHAEIARMGAVARWHRWDR